MKRVYNLHPAYILANKEQVWGPYDPIPYRGFRAANPPAWVTVTPAAAAGGQPTIHVRSYDDLVREVIANFPPTMTTPPPEDHRMVGVRRALADPNRRSINHEMYVEDEKHARRTVALFMRENGNAARQAVMNQHPALGQWEQSDLHRSLVNVPQAAIVANPTVRLNLAPPGLGICGTGQTGVAGSVTNHQANLPALPALPAAAAIHQGGDPNQGIFIMPGTPQHR